MPHAPEDYDFFVSYAREDNKSGWITGFVEELVAEHKTFSGGRTLTYFFDKADIHHFDDWQSRIHHALSRSRLFLAFVSPSYFASEWCRREWKGWIDTEIATHILSSGAAPIYLIEVPGFVGKVKDLSIQEQLDESEVARKVAELCGLPSPHNAFIASASPVIRQMRDRRQVATDFVRPFARDGLSALRQNDLRQVLNTLAKDLDERAALVRAAEESANTVPSYNRKFSGRLEELLDLRDKLKDDRAGVITGIHGLGGIGKTELAFTYAHAFAGVYPGGRFYIPCEGKTRLRDALLTLGDFHAFHDQITDEERKQPDVYFSALIRCLGKRLREKGHVLLLLDNVTDMKILRREETDALVMGPSLHLLATTRLSAPKGADWLTLGELPDEDALDLLDKFRPIGDERDAALRLVKRLGGFTLAVELVAAWLAAHPGSTYTTLLEGFGLEDLETDMAADQDIELSRHNHERRLTAVLEPVLQSLTPPQLRTLEYASLLPPDSAPLPWLKDLLATDFPEALKPTRLIGDPWKEIWQRLLGLALFSLPQDGAGEPRLVRVHRLVQEVVRARMSNRITPSQEAVNTLVKARITVLNKISSWKDARWEVEPLDALANLWDEMNHPNVAWLMNEVGRYWHALAEWSRAEPLMRRALAIDEASYGPDHPSVAIRLSNVAGLFQATNRLAEAEPLYRRALAISETSYGPDHPNVAVHLSNLALLLKATNRLAEAEPLYRRALAISETSYGPDHPNVAVHLNNLAQLFQTTNRLDEAEPLMRRALAIDETSYGPDHPRVATRLNNLARLFQETNRLDEAEPLMRRALAIDETSYGPDHPNVATYLHNLAGLLRDTNRLDEAEPLMRRALAISEASYGPDHPNVAVHLNNLAQLFQTTNRLDEAEPLMRRALAISETSYGPDHPNVAVHLNNLAQLFQTTNRLDEAEPLMRRALAIDETSYGPDHPRVATRLNNLARLFQDTNRLYEAEPLMRRALAISETSYGPDHPNVATSLHNLAGLLRDTNRLDEGEPLVRRALEILIAVWYTTGFIHPHLQAVTNNYAGLLQASGMTQEEILAYLQTMAPELFEDE